MKKLFIAALALASVVACSKDDAPVLESSKKAVEISISNYTPNTRAITNPESSEITADGQVGTIEEQAVNNYAAAKSDQLVVLFANNANKVEQAFALEGLTSDNGKYTFHNINESVTQVAVVRKANATKGDNGVWSYDYDTDADNYVGKELETYKDAALVEYTDNRGVDGMDLFAASGQLTNPVECNVPATEHTEGYTYMLYSAEVEVKPMLARVEVTKVSAQGGENPLGATTLAAFNGDLVSGGYDELVLGTLKFGGNYTFDFDKYTLKGVYDKGVGEREATIFEAGDDSNKYAIAWNIATKTAFPLTTENAMTIDMVASAYDYTVVNTAKNLTIGFDNVDPQEFEAGKIYRLAIEFGEDNLDASNDAICVEVTVKVANWVVVDVDPVFGN